jgi:carbonic anhydrase/acetyltransferase-like protein (isoleucine patch superfamily)
MSEPVSPGSIPSGVLRSPGLIDVHPSVYLHESAIVYGKVSIGAGTSVWPNAVMRAENDGIRIGRMSNIQDHAMIHVGTSDPSVIGDFCSITHRVVVHGARIGDHCLIGIGAVLMDGCEIGAGSIVAGGAFVPEGKVYPPNSIIIGMPAKAVAERDSTAANRLNAWMYWRNAQAYQRGDHRAWDGPEHHAFLDEIKAKIADDTDLTWSHELTGP